MGARPGDCYADVIFSYLWCRILKLLQGELQRLQLGEEINEDGGLHICADRHVPCPLRPFLGPTGMDDACICVSSETALGVEHKTTHAAGLLLQFCEQHALPPNLQRGKTEILFAFQGAESRKLKKKYFGPTHFGSLSDMNPANALRSLSNPSRSIKGIFYAIPS